MSSDYPPKDWQGTFNVLTQKISRQLIVQDNLLLTVLRHVVQSRCVFLDDDSTPSHYFISQAPEVHLYCRCVSRSATRIRFSTRQRENGCEETNWAKALKTVA